MIIIKEEIFSTYPDVLTVPQACEALHIGKALLYRMLSENEIYSVRVGRGYRIPKFAIKEFVCSK
ncbi:MAG: excisionase family DNA-binding protein [Clostridiaceae bacterium]|nr:excisionase family DNA-binding protein [Clostridiaceae bacterium]